MRAFYRTWVLPTICVVAALVGAPALLPFIPGF